jgi:hypothetical protein
MRVAVLITLLSGAWLFDGQRVALAQTAADSESSTDRLVLVVGAPGEDEYRDEFQRWAAAWLALAERQNWQCTAIGDVAQSDVPASDQDIPAVQALQQAVESHDASQGRLWIVLLGHGTFARNVAKFNLPGADVSAQQLGKWLKRIDSQVVIINCSSSSAPFLTELAGENRIVLTATRSGSELNYSRFGKFLAEAVADVAADIDHDKEVSLLEAFLAASSQTERFYREDARLATEHALLDDNGDRAGTSADFYRGIRPAKEATAGKTLDGMIAGRIILYSSPDSPVFSAELEQQRTRIEARIDSLRKQKAQLASETYFDQLEQLLLELAAVYDAAESS